MKKLFVVKIDNMIDLITNSSSELFVLKTESLQNCKEMLECAVYPDDLSEYEEVVSLNDANEEQISTYLSWIEDEDDWNQSINQKIQSAKVRAEKFGFTPEDFYVNWEKSINDKYFYPRIKDENLKICAEKLDPEGKIFLLFSLDENPNYEIQQKLENVAERYHLG